MNTFDPVLFSDAENRFLLEHVGKPPIVALKDVAFPVNAKAVRPVLERVAELKAQEAHEGIAWAGEDVIKDAIRTWFEQNAKWKAERTRNRKAPRFPSLLSYDTKGRGHRSGPGSDSHRVRTYFDATGKRVPFEVALVSGYEQDVEYIAPHLAGADVDAASALHEDEATHRFECRVEVSEGRICGHTESYKADSRQSRALARARISKHLRKATEAVEAHRELYTHEFGSAN